MKIQKSLLLTGIFQLTSFSYAIENATNTDSDSKIDSKEYTVVDGVKSTLSNYYLNKNTNNKQEIELIEKQPVLAPYNCSPWIDIGGGKEQRTCSVKLVNIKKNKNIKEFQNN